MKSGEFIPGGVEGIAGHCEAGVATSADEVREILFAGEEPGLKGIVFGKLEYAYHAFCRAVWAKPMGLFAVGGRFLEYIRGKAGCEKFMLVAAEMRFKAFECEKFCFERVSFHGYCMMLVDERKIRRLVFNKLLLEVNDGGVDAGVVRKVADGLDGLKDCFERGRESCRCCGKGGHVEHGEIPFACAV